MTGVSTFAPDLVLIGDGAGIRIGRHHRRQQDPPRIGTDRQERAVGRAPVRAERRQDDLGHRIVALQQGQQCRVELAGAVALGRAAELVLEPERIEKFAQLGVVVMAEAFEALERIGHRGQRLADMLGQHLLVRHVVGHRAQPVHIVRKCKQTRRDVAECLEGAAHHDGTRDLAERADMRQAGRAIAGLEQGVALFRRLAIEPRQEFARLLERPGAGVLGKCADGVHGLFS